MPGVAGTVVGTAAAGDTLMPTRTHLPIKTATRMPSRTAQVSQATIPRRIMPWRTITPVGIKDGAMAGVGDAAWDGAPAVVGGDEACGDLVIGEPDQRADGGRDI